MVMKWSEKLLHIAVVAAIISSIALSAAIWLNVGQQDSQKEDSKTTQTVQKRQRQMLALPAQVAYHQTEVYLQSKEKQTYDTMKKIAQIEYEPIKNLSNNLDDLSQFKSGVTLSYCSPMSFQFFKTIFDLKIKKEDSNFEFTKVVYDSQKEQLIFMNQYTGSVHTFKAVSSTSEMKDYLKQDFHGIAAEYYNEELGYLPKNAIKVSHYRYVIATQAYSVYTQAFFNRPDEVNAKNSSGGVELTNSADDVLTLNNQNNEVKYQGTFKVDQNENRMLAVLDLVSRLGNELGNLRYLTQSQQQFDYRVFVEGYPIMGNHYLGEVLAKLNDQHIQIFTSQSVIQVPVPDNDQTTLQSGKDTLKALKKDGVNISRIQAMQIGYQWKETSQSDEIRLVPTWYFYVNHQWKSLAEMEEGA